MQTFVWANDPDNALEISGNGADLEFESAEDARKGFDPDFHGNKKLFKVTVEEVLVDE